MKKLLLYLKPIFASLFILLSFSMSVWAQINIQVTQTITENFDGIGTSATATLPANWKIDNLGAVRTVGSYATAETTTTQRGGNNMATNATNGRYNFGAGAAATANDRAVGGLSSSTGSESVNVYTHLFNSGTQNIDFLQLSYDVEKYRMGTNTAGFQVQLYYSSDGIVWTSAGAEFNTVFPADTDNTGYANAPGDTKSIVNKNLNVSIPTGGNLYLAWNYSVISGSTTTNAQALGIDNVIITGKGPYINLTYPVGGEVLYADEAATIKWTSDYVDNVKVEVWVPSESVWVVLAASVPAAAGEFSLRIPSDARYSTAYKIRVSDVSAPSMEDTSNDFTIIGFAGNIHFLKNYHQENDLVMCKALAQVSFVRTDNFNQKYIQDGGGGILIHDPAGVITIALNNGDYLSSLLGKITINNGIKQFEPLANPIAANWNETVVPTDLTIEEYNQNYLYYESMLIRLKGVKFPAGDGSATFVASNNYIVSDGTSTTNFRTHFKNTETNINGSVIPDKFMNLTGIALHSSGTPLIASRFLSDFLIPNDDATLSVFTIGGVNVLTLDNIVVPNPSEGGAFLKVDDFVNFTGIVATTNEAQATRKVFVNGVLIGDSNLQTFIFTKGDVVAVEVAATDGITIKYYRVTLVDEIPYINITKPIGGEIYYPYQTLRLEWETNVTGMLLLEVEFPDGSFQIVDQVEASLGFLDLPIPNGIPSGNYRLKLIWEDNPAVYSQSGISSVIDNLSPNAAIFRPGKGASNVQTDTKLQIGFDENVIAKTGNIVVKKASDNSVFASIDVTSGSVVYNGNNIEITLPNLLEAATTYYVLIDQGAFKDLSNNEFEGITNVDFWRFTTAGFYDITIAVTDGTNSVEGATVTLFTDPIQELMTNAQGIAVFADIPYGHYGASVMKAGYNSYFATVYADRDKSIPVVLIPVGATTYSVTFEITHKGNSFPNAEIQLEGYGQRWTNDEGIAVFNTVLPAANIPYSVTYWDIKTLEGTVTVVDQNVVEPVSVNKVYTVVFIVKDAVSVLKDASVSFDSRVIETTAGGFAIFENVEEGENKPYTISKTGYVSVAGTVEVEDDWKQFYITLEKEKFTITFEVNDGVNALAGAAVDFNGEQKTTDALGKTVFTNVEYATNKAYTVTKAGYTPANGTLDATENKTQIVSLQLIKYVVTFTVTHGINPVANAQITVSGQSPITTNTSGVATINLAPGNYTYNVSATGYVSLTGIGFNVIDANKAIPVSLSAVNIVNPGNQPEKLLVYPNPSNGLFTIEIASVLTDRIYVEVLDITGKVIYRNNFVALGYVRETIDLQNLNKGMYFLRVNEAGKISTLKLIFR